MNPRPCPICAEIFQPRKVGSKWTKSCSKKCAYALTAAAMRAGGGSKAARAKVYPERVELTCEVCGHKWAMPPSQVSGRRTCSWDCAATLKRRETGGTRRGKSNPNFRNGSRVGERNREGEARWYAAAKDFCEHPDCPAPRGMLVLHHILYRQLLVREGGDIYDPRNAMTLCNGCHMSHHRRGKMVIPLSALPDSVFGFAVETLGFGPAYEYLRRVYRDGDARLDALIEEEAA